MRGFASICCGIGVPCCWLGVPLSEPSGLEVWVVLEELGELSLTHEVSFSVCWAALAVGSILEVEEEVFESCFGLGGLENGDERD